MLYTYSVQAAIQLSMQAAYQLRRQCTVRVLKLLGKETKYMKSFIRCSFENEEYDFDNLSSFYEIASQTNFNFVDQIPESPLGFAEIVSAFVFGQGDAVIGSYYCNSPSSLDHFERISGIKPVLPFFDNETLCFMNCIIEDYDKHKHRLIVNTIRVNASDFSYTVEPLREWIQDRPD